ncbi:MAG: glycoside hydrolase family 125 protein [Bacteroidales bacterium]
MERKDFLKVLGVSAATAAVAPSLSYKAMAREKDIPSNRPQPEERKFRSRVIDDYIEYTQSQIKDETLKWMFGNCFPNTLDTTVFQGTFKGKPDTFVITGDIHACWLRDSSAQVWPFMPFVNKDDKLSAMIKGLINRHAASVLLDPYANAFCESTDNFCASFPDDEPRAKNGVFERKWEVDSLCYVIRLAYRYWQETQDTSFMDEDWLNAMNTIVSTFKTEQRKNGGTPYSYARKTSRTTDTSFDNGLGRPFYPCGAICSSFRPSDDSTLWNFLVPSNFFAVKQLENLAVMLTATNKSPATADEARTLANEVRQALLNYAIYNHPSFGKIYCYEFDGLGNQNLMDDANSPSLLSLPYFELVDRNDPIYNNTRQFLLSKKNGWYSEGTAAKGIGSPHTGRDQIWPMSLSMQAMTSEDEDEIMRCLHYLLTTHNNTGFMHESFDNNDPSQYSRAWFAWANGLFGEMVIHVNEKFPRLLRKKILKK